VGETITVKVAKVGTTVTEVTLSPGATVGDALTAAGYSSIPEGHQIRRMNSIVDVTDRVHDGDLLTILPKFKAGRKFSRILFRI